MIETLLTHDHALWFTYGAAFVLALLCFCYIAVEVARAVAKAVSRFVAWRRIPAWHRK